MWPDLGPEMRSVFVVPEPEIFQRAIAAYKTSHVNSNIAFQCCQILDKQLYSKHCHVGFDESEGTFPATLLAFRSALATAKRPYKVSLEASSAYLRVSCDPFANIGCSPGVLDVSRPIHVAHVLLEGDLDTKKCIPWPDIWLFGLVLRSARDSPFATRLGHVVRTETWYIGYL